MVILGEGLRFNPTCALLLTFALGRTDDVEAGDACAATRTLDGEDGRLLGVPREAGRVISIFVVTCGSSQV